MDRKPGACYGPIHADGSIHILAMAFQLTDRCSGGLGRMKEAWTRKHAKWSRRVSLTVQVCISRESDIPSSLVRRLWVAGISVETTMVYEAATEKYLCATDELEEHGQGQE